MNRIHSLDGLRAISILFVMISHVTIAMGITTDGPHRRLGGLGVRIFFLISGFLITRLLLNEHAKTGAISLRGFYYRRLLRITPASTVYLVTITLLAAFGVMSLQRGDLAHAWTYTMNFKPERAWPLGHLWSLSVEEQFYLLWPGLLCLFGIARAQWLAGTAIVLCPLIRVVCHLYFPSQRLMIGESFYTICDALATGCFLATVHDSLGSRPRYLQFLQSRRFALLLLMLAVVFALCADYRFAFPVGETMLNVLIAICIDKWVRYPYQDGIGRFLNLRPVMAIGVISYSLYLWQQIFLNPEWALPITRFPLNVVLAFAAATASYYLVEKPMLALRSRHGNPAERTVAGSMAARRQAASATN